MVDWLVKRATNLVRKVGGKDKPLNRRCSLWCTSKAEKCIPTVQGQRNIPSSCGYNQTQISPMIFYFQSGQETEKQHFTKLPPNGAKRNGTTVVQIAVQDNCTSPECAGAELLVPTENPPTTEEQKMDHFVSIWLTHEVRRAHEPLDWITPFLYFLPCRRGETSLDFSYSWQDC